jgi:hypothetical protein
MLPSASTHLSLNPAESRSFEGKCGEGRKIGSVLVWGSTPAVSRHPTYYAFALSVSEPIETTTARLTGIEFISSREYTYAQIIPFFSWRVWLDAVNVRVPLLSSQPSEQLMICLSDPSIPGIRNTTFCSR